MEAMAQSVNDPYTRQVSGFDPEGRPILSVLVKKTYELVPGRRCMPAVELLPLIEEPVYDAADRTLLHDTDLFPMKLMTDVVLKATAYAPARTSSFIASVKVGGDTKQITVVGDRRCYLDSFGKLVMTQAEQVEQVPLQYEYAYGGRDLEAEKITGNPFLKLAPYLQGSINLSECSLYRYPRNPIGRGYLIAATPAAVERLVLPNLEDPLDPLHAERLPVGRPDNWLRMPLPQGLGFIDYGWFPRSAYFGLVPLHAPFEGLPAEAARHYAPAEVLHESTAEPKVSHRSTNGASLGLQLPFLQGDEECILRCLHPRWPQLVFRLPGVRPRIWVDGRDGKLLLTDPVLHTVYIDPEASRLSLLWRGSAVAKRPYLPEELTTMPLRVEW